MVKASKSGLSVNAADVPKILGMAARGDRRHDIAAWFGLNQGRIAEVENGKHGNPPLAPPSQLPPSGSPGPKALAIREAVRKALADLANGKKSGAHVADGLKAAAAQFDKNE
jgi:hypothetical protein